VDNSVVALIGAGGSGLVAITPPVLNSRGFAAIDERFASVECRLDALQADIKQFNKRIFDSAARAINEEGFAWTIMC